MKIIKYKILGFSMIFSTNCLLAIVICQIIAISQAQESFILEEFRGYPMFREDEIRGRRTVGNVMRSMESENSDDSYWDSSARKKSETFFTQEQVDKVLAEAFREEPFSEEAGTVRNNVGESLIAKHAHDGNIPLSIIENERSGNPYQRDIVENELVESPFSDMDTGMKIGRKFRHKVL